MKLYFILTFILGLSIGLVALIKLSPDFKTQTINNKEKANINKKSNKEYNIAILMPVTHPALEEIKDSFIAELNQHINNNITVYNAQGNRTLMRNQAEEIVSKNYDLVFSIATQPAIILKQVSFMRNSQVPIVAGAVEDPVYNELVNSIESSGNNLTTVSSIANLQDQIDLLLTLKPNINNILLVYNPTPILEKRKSELETITKKYNIALNTVEIFQSNETAQKAAQAINQAQIVLVLKDNMVVSAIESLVNLCNKNNKLLYASDLNSSDKGTALAYGIYESQYGVESTKKALEILLNNKKPSDIPSTIIADYKLIINSNIINVEPRLLKLLKEAIVK